MPQQNPGIILRNRASSNTTIDIVSTPPLSPVKFHLCHQPHVLCGGGCSSVSLFPTPLLRTQLALCTNTYCHGLMLLRSTYLAHFFRLGMHFGVPLIRSLCHGWWFWLFGTPEQRVLQQPAVAASSRSVRYERSLISQAVASTHWVRVV